MLEILKESNYAILAPVKHYLRAEDNRQLDKKNLFLTDFIPAHLLAPFIDFSILHGGEGTVQTACLSGKPFIGFGLQYEQQTNLHNCEVFGNALSLNPKKLSESVLKTAIACIQEPQYSEKAKEMQQLMADFVQATYF